MNLIPKMRPLRYPMQLLVIVALMVVTSGCGRVQQRRPMEFVEVCILLAGSSSQAYKSVTRDGLLRGGHLSGVPDAQRVFEDRGWMAADDMATLAGLVATLPYAQDSHSASDEARLVEIVLPGGKRYRIAADVIPTAHAIWELLYRQPVGAW